MPESISGTNVGPAPRSPVPPLPLPWETAVNGDTLLAEIEALFSMYVFLPAGASTALALWTVHTYANEAAQHFPILSAVSPQKRCGKTTLLRVLKGLVRQPVMASNYTAATIYRLIETFRPTLLIDEADTYLATGGELIGILNSGHTRDGQVVRNEQRGETWIPAVYSTWGSKSIAAIGKLPETLADRSITIPLHRRPRSVEIVRYDSDAEETFSRTARKIVRWVGDNLDDVKATDPRIPPDLDDRSADNWRPLLAIAQIVGGDWPERARRAALLLAPAADDALSIPEMLLADIRMIFESSGASQIATGEILKRLAALEERPWNRYRGQRPMNPQELAVALKDFGIRATKLRIGERTCQGYKFDPTMREVFDRYTPQRPEQVEQAEQPHDVPNVPDVPDTLG